MKQTIDDVRQLAAANADAAQALQWKLDLLRKAVEDFAAQFDGKCDDLARGIRALLKEQP